MSQGNQAQENMVCGARIMLVNFFSLCVDNFARATVRYTRNN